MKPDNRTALLVIIRSNSRAAAVQLTLSAHGIDARVQRKVTAVVEFGGKLGITPSEVYVRGEDLVRSKEILDAGWLPERGGDSEPWQPFESSSH